MDNHHKRRYVTSSADDDDIITNFPEDLINPILERLPVKDAVRTSVLSKNWRYRWTTMRTLDLQYQFSNQFSNIGAFSHNGFIRVISHIMIHHQGPISKFALHIPKEIVLDSFQEVDQWMLILSRNNLRVLDFRNSNRIYQIPSSVFSCLELRVLSLDKCIFRPPHEFKGFQNLEEIIFSQVNFRGGSVINLPQLKALTLFRCSNVNSFNIKAEMLQILRVDSCREDMLLRLLHSQHLYAVKVCLLKSLNELLRVTRFTFTIDGYFLKFMAAGKISEWLSHAKWLTRLNFQSVSLGDLDQLHGALCMLRNSPNVKLLRVTYMPMGLEADLELTSSYLESQYQTLFMLQSVEMIYIEGTRPEMLFIKLLLDQSPHLKKMIIRPRATVDAEKRLNIAKDVMQFPRASTKAKMVFVDPEP
ncbi:putative F-box domain, FBD domain, leucine-rich repeat domain superfamily [Helianthus debilis subsp. tardiflorus]